ncbi:unnamed protein product [Rhodiola kirilowii]
METIVPSFGYLGGLGSRGLLYHALLGKLTANAVVSCNEHIIPCQFTSWNKTNNA